jgi:hypothetical protein
MLKTIFITFCERDLEKYIHESSLFFGTNVAFPASNALACEAGGYQLNYGPENMAS